MSASETSPVRESGKFVPCKYSVSNILCVVYKSKYFKRYPLYIGISVNSNFFLYLIVNYFYS